MEVSTPAHAHSTPPRTATSESLSPLSISHPSLVEPRAVASDETSQTSSLSSEEEPGTLSRPRGNLSVEVPDTDDELTDIEDAHIPNNQDEDPLKHELIEIDRAESAEMADDEHDPEDEGAVGGEDSLDDEVNSDGEDSLDDEVTPDGEVADEAETPSSTENDNLPSPDDDDDSDFSDFEEPKRSRRKRKRKAKSISTQDLEAEPKLVMRGTPNLTLKAHLKAQVCTIRKSKSMIEVY